MVSRSFPPMMADHPMAQERCPACGDVFEGQASVLLVLGPGSDPEALEKMQQGRWFNAAAVAVHEACSIANVGPPSSVDPRKARLAVLRFVEWEGKDDDGRPICLLCRGRKPNHDQECELRMALLQDTRLVSPDDRCPDCGGVVVWDDATHRTVCEACGQELRERR